MTLQVEQRHLPLDEGPVTMAAYDIALSVGSHRSPQWCIQTGT